MNLFCKCDFNGSNIECPTKYSKDKCIIIEKTVGISICSILFFIIIFIIIYYLLTKDLKNSLI